MWSFSIVLSLDMMSNMNSLMASLDHSSQKGKCTDACESNRGSLNEIVKEREGGKVIFSDPRQHYSVLNRNAEAAVHAS